MQILLVISNKILCILALVEHGTHSEKVPSVIDGLEGEGGISCGSV